MDENKKEIEALIATNEELKKALRFALGHLKRQKGAEILVMDIHHLLRKADR